MLKVDCGGDGKGAFGISVGQDPVTLFHLFFFTPRECYAKGSQRRLPMTGPVPQEQCKQRKLSGKGRMDSPRKQCNEPVSNVSMFLIAESVEGMN